jgi:hypothetical protein
VGGGGGERRGEGGCGEGMGGEKRAVGWRQVCMWGEGGEGWLGGRGGMEVVMLVRPRR